MGTEEGQEENFETGALINETTIRQYFAFLCEDENEIFTVCWLLEEADGSKKNVPGYGTWHGKANEIIEKTRELQSIYGISVSLHCVLNRTNLLGKKTGNIESARVLAVDSDIEKPTQTKRKENYNKFDCPGMEIESSPGKHHFYWKIEENITLSEWQTWQSGLALLYEGDSNLSQVSKSLRVPGVARRLKTGEIWLPKIESFKVWPVSRQRAIGVFKLNEAAAILKESQTEQRKKLHKSLENPCILKGEEFAGVGRNNFLYESIKQEVSKYKAGQEEMLGYSGAFALAELLNRQFETPLDAREVEATCASAYEKGKFIFEKRRENYLRTIGRIGAVEVEVQEKYTNGHGGHAASVDESQEESTGDSDSFAYDSGDPWLAGNSFSDFGLAARVLQRFGSRLVKCNNILLSFSEDVKCWREQRKGESTELPQMIGNVIYDLRRDAEFLRVLCSDKDGFNEGLYKKALGRFESDQKMRAVSSLVRTSGRIKELSRGDFDRVDNLLYVSNGLLNLDSGAIRDVTPEDYLICQTRVKYVPGATCEGWVGFLEEVYDGDKAVIDFVQEVFGYSLQGGINEQVIFCHYGDGSNGKSRVLGALGALMDGYCTTLAPDDMSFNDKLSAKPFERVAAKIEGNRVVILDDLEVAERWSETTVKNLTSGRVRARAEYEVSREITNRAKVHLGLNVAPKPQAENYGLLRRLCFIPYTRRFAGSSESTDRIDRMISEELSGILNWAISGYRKWRARGKLVLPEACLEAIQEYKEEHFDVESLVLEMWEKAEEETEENFATTDNLVEEFNQRLAARGVHKKLTPVGLGRELKAVLGAKEDRKRASGPKKRGFYLIWKVERNSHVLHKLGKIE